MDDADFLDDVDYSPHKRPLDRVLRLLGLVLIGTFFLRVLPEGRPAESIYDTKHIWSLFGGGAGALELTRLTWPLLMGVAFVVLGFLRGVGHKWRATIASGLLVIAIVIGVDPLGILDVVLPPVSGDVESLEYIEDVYDVTLRMRDGAYFPREDLMHTALLTLGLLGLGIGGRYRSVRQASRLGGFMLMGGLACLSFYYLIPYAGRVPAVANQSLYRGFYDYGKARMAEADELEEALDDAPSYIRPEIEAGIAEGRMLGRLRFTAYYFLFIYFVPAALGLLGILAWDRSRWRGDRVGWARLASWGASAYVLAFSLPLVLRESMFPDGIGVQPHLRAYLLFGAVMVSATVCGAIALAEWIEPDDEGERLPDDPNEWGEPEAEPEAWNTEDL